MAGQQGHPKHGFGWPDGRCMGGLGPQGQREARPLDDLWLWQGRPQDLGGGGQEFFFRFGNLHVAKRHAAHGETMRIARGFGGMLPREKFLKRCNLVRFSVYFDQILSLFFSENYHFLYKK